VDYYENSGQGAQHYAEWLNAQNYRGVDWVPHDARVREWSSGRTRLETLRALGRKPRLVPDHSVMDGINAARLTIPQAYFDAARCGRGLECLRNYQAEWDEQLRTFKRTPKHDWASHGADAWRYLSMSWREPVPADDEEPDPIAELLRPRTMDDVWREYAEERIEAGADPELLELQ
jgi:phage terminase large subunit